MEKKISFGFFKQLKKPNIKPVEPEEKKQFIDCLEGNSIKVLGGEVVDEIKPLVIPLREKDKTTTASVLAQIARGQLDLQAEETEGAGSTPVIVEAPAVPIQNESLDKMAEREILEDLKKDAIKTSNNSNLVVPVADTLKLTGEKESTLEDYENIPVGDFGMAMLRGMGWQPGTGMGKHSKSSELILPNLRPKGMGLGADKVSSSSKSTETSIGKEELKLEKGAYVKIIKGKQNGTYGQISGFDEDSGRLIVKAAIGGSNIDINEHMVEAISKNEYQKMSKVINSAKYEEYKNRELKNTSQEKHKEPDSDKKIYTSRPKSPRRSPEEYSSHRENKSHQKTHEEQVSSSRPSHTRDSRRDKYHRSPSRSSSSSPPRERDTEKKRKGKKKRRDKSRSRERRRH